MARYSADLAVDGDGVCADIDVDEDVDLFMVVEQRKPPRICVLKFGVGLSCGGKARHPRCGRPPAAKSAGWSGPH